MEPVALVVAVDVIKKCVSGERSEFQRGFRYLGGWIS